MEELSMKRKGDEAVQEGSEAKKSRASDAAGTDTLSCTGADLVGRGAADLKKQKDMEGDRIGDVSNSDPNSVELMGGAAALKKRKDREEDQTPEFSDPNPNSMVVLGGASTQERRRNLKQTRLIRDQCDEHPDSIELGRGGSGRVRQGGLPLEPEQQSALPIVHFHDPDPGDLLVLAPPRIGGAQPVVSFREFSRGLRETLFGPETRTDGPVSIWSDTNEPCIPCTDYFTAGYNEVAVGPPVKFAVIHMQRKYYIPFLMYHKSGLAGLAHEPVHQNRALRAGEEDIRVRSTTLNIRQTNRGLIRAAVHRLLTPPRRREDCHPAACIRCGEPADWATSCCQIHLCSYCLPREVVMRHLRGFCPCQAREQGGTTLRPLHDRSRDPGTHGPGLGWACTRQLLVQVEEEEQGRTVPRDVFLFRTFTSLEDLQSLRPPQRHTGLYHMTMDGLLRRVCIIQGAELPFLW